MTDENHSIQNPASLQDSTINYICENLLEVCSAVTDSSDETRLKFKDEQTFLHAELSEQLLHKLCDKKLLDDLVMTLFNCESTRLKQVRFRDASKLSVKGLKTLRGHRIQELEAVGLSKATVTDLISCLGEWSLLNLRNFNVANSTFVDSNKFCVVVALAKLRNLQALNVSRTEFNRTSLELVVEDLPKLESLNISCTQVNDISALRKCKSRLKVLAMSGLKFPAQTPHAIIVDILTDLTELVHLDVSDDRNDHGHCVTLLNTAPKFRVSALLQKYEALPKLQSLDISGNGDIVVNDLIEFLLHHQLRFLGLVFNDVCSHPIFTDPSHSMFFPKLVVAGLGNEGQVLESLQRYHDRPHFIAKSLYRLFKMTATPHEPRIDVDSPRIDIIQLVLSCAQEFPTVFPIQMAATACLFNLSKAELGNKIHPGILRKIVQADLDAMETFPQHQQLQKNVLLTMYSHRILQEVDFDKYRCTRLVLDCLCSWQDHQMNKMSVTICSNLAAKISTEEMSELGSKPNYMKKLLSIVRDRTQEAVVDITLKFTLSALWNLTDDSPKTCKVFLDESGMDLYISVLDTFPNFLAIETKILGLFNNIAEVPELRKHLANPKFIENLRNLLNSKSKEVSYFAAGIVSHLLSDWTDVSAVTKISKGCLSRELWTVVCDWKNPEEKMVSYRSFKPFFPLLKPSQEDSVQMWAVWAIHHVCSRNPTRYCEMLASQGGHTVLLNLVRDPATNPTVANTIDQILATMVQQQLLSQEEVLEKREVYVSF